MPAEKMRKRREKFLTRKRRRFFRKNRSRDVARVGRDAEAHPGAVDFIVIHQKILGGAGAADQYG